MKVHRLFIVTIGWTETPVIRLVVRHGLETGDFILLVRPVWHDEKAETAMGAIVDFLSKMLGEAWERSYRTLSIQASSPIDAIETIKIVLEYYEAEKIVVILSGGMRAVILETLIALIFSRHFNEAKDITVEVDLEGRNEYVRFEGRILRLFNWRPTKEQEKLLKLLEESPKTMRELAENLGINVSTVYRWYEEMQKLGILGAYKEGSSRSMKLRLTPLYKLVV